MKIPQTPAEWAEGDQPAAVNWCVLEGCGELVLVLSYLSTLSPTIGGKPITWSKVAGAGVRHPTR